VKPSGGGSQRDSKEFFYFLFKLTSICLSFLQRGLNFSKNKTNSQQLIVKDNFFRKKNLNTVLQWLPFVSVFQKYLCPVSVIASNHFFGFGGGLCHLIKKEV